MITKNKLAGIGFITALAASLCCLTPVLALTAGAGGLASAFSWLEPLRPWLIGVTAGALALAWYQKLKPQKEIDCDCTVDEKPKFTRSKRFLGIITLFAVVMISFPFYSDFFTPSPEEKKIVVDQADIQTVEFKISGMTCGGCAKHVDREVNKLSGVVSAKASYDEGNTIVAFDKSKTSIEEVEAAIKSTGYAVTGQNEN